MPDPIQVERLFQEVTSHIESTPSIRHRYKLFREFTEMLEGSYKKYESYIVQIFDELPLYSVPLNWSGIDPRDIEADLLLLEDIQSSIELSEKSTNFHKIKSNLQQVCLLLFCCVNHTEKIDDYLQKITGLSFNEPFNKKALKGENQTIDKLYELLSKEILTEKNRTKEQQESIQELYDQLLILRKSEDWSVFIPVAEKYEKDYQKRNSYGRLRKMTVELYGVAESGSTDELIWASNVYGAEVHALKQTSGIIKASRSLFDRTSSNSVNKKKYRGGIRFQNTAAIHDGSSANLAISALWYTHLLKASGHREHYFINKNIAITGDIDVNESVQPVDENSIGIKTKAVFFSWAKIFVIPASQSGLFEAEIQKLQKRYPGRSLPVIGVNHLREIFYDRRVAIHDAQAWVPYAINRLKNEHSRFLFIAIIAFLLLTVARLAYGPVDRNAVDIEYEGSHLILKNQTGFVLDRIEVGETTVNYQNTGRRATQYPLAALADLDEDGTNELIFINRIEQSNLETSTLKAWSVTGDSLIWEHPITFNYHYHRQSAFINLGLRASELQLMNTNDGPKVVLNAGLIQYFQSVAFTIDAVSGEIEQEYVHPGRLNDIMVFDIDGDEIDELIFTGINNAFWKAMVGVLEYGEAQGYGPATRDYIPAGLNPANEEVYLLIPKSVIGKYFNTVWKYNMGERIHYDLLTENFYFTVVEGTKRFTEFEDEIQVIFYFNRDLKPVGIGTNDLYDITARDLHGRGEISIEPDFDYFESLQDSILYWNGEEFLKTNDFFDTNELQKESR